MQSVQDKDEGKDVWQRTRAVEQEVELGQTDRQVELRKRWAEFFP